MYNKSNRKVFFIMAIVLIMLISCGHYNKNNELFVINDIEPAIKFANEEYISLNDFKTVKFGNYYISNKMANTLEPIEWIVLDKNMINNRALLLSKYILDYEPYNKVSDKYSFEESSIKLWLNNYFYSIVFDDDERKRIVLIEDKNKANDDIEATTYDEIFLLNSLDCYKYFGANQSKNSKLATISTEYAKKKYNTIAGKDSQKNNKLNYFWIDSVGNNFSKRMVVNNFGTIIEEGIISTNYIGIRPAIWVKY